VGKEKKEATGGSGGWVRVRRGAGRRSSASGRLDGGSCRLWKSVSREKETGERASVFMVVGAGKEERPRVLGRGWRRTQRRHRQWPFAGRRRF